MTFNYFDGLKTLVRSLVLVGSLTLTALASPEDESSSLNVQLLDSQPEPAAREFRLASRVSNRGYLWPVRGAILSPYGPRGGRIHPGLDIDGNMGQTVFAARSGMIVTAGAKYSGYGNMVDILHDDGVVTRYGHATRVLVRVGQQVNQGQPIMTLGCTGRCSGPHVHFEVRIGGRAVNPLPYLR